MTSIIVAILISAVASALLTPLARLLGLRLGAVSTPGGRHVHGRTIPRTGGIAIFGAFCVPMLGLYLVHSSTSILFHQEMRRMLGLVIGGAAMCLVGFIDDTRHMRALHKLLAQIAVAIFAYYMGFQIESITLPSVDGLPSGLQMGIFALPVTMIWIVGVINAINLIDGLDGLAAGMVFFAALTNLVVAHVSGGGELIKIPMASVLGSVVGFLLYNFNPARIFMGDSGSYFLGYVIATSALVGTSQKASTAVSLLVPMIALGVPIFDTLFAMVRRFLERRPIFSADRGHIHHRLLDMGLTHRRAVLILYGIAVVCTLTAISISVGHNWQTGAVILIASVGVFGVVRFAAYFQQVHTARRQRSRMRSPDTERLRQILPEVARRLGGCATEDELLVQLKILTDRAGICQVEILQNESDLDAGLVVHAWTHAEHGSPEHPDLLSARYPLGPDNLARASLKFRWLSDVADVSPQAEILLQIVTDITSTELQRLGSALAPQKPVAAISAAKAVETGPASA